MRPGKTLTTGLFSTLLGLIALLLTGCGGTSPPLQTQKPTPAPASQQVFRSLLLNSDIPTLDPALAADFDSLTAIGTVFTGLVQLDDQLNLKPQMATSWATSSDGLTWTFHLKSSLQFSDGTPLNASDVAYSINRALKKTTQSPVALTYLGLIKDSEKLNSGAISTIIGGSLLVPDSNTLVIRLNRPGAYFLDALTSPTSFPVERRLIDKYGASWTEHLTEGGGAGPFKVAMYTHRKSLTLVPNPNYYGPKPRLQQLQFFFYADENTARQAYEANQLDFTTIPPSYSETDKALSDFHRTPVLILNYLAMNYLVKPFDNIKIRQAFALALDKNVLAHRVLKDTFLATNHIVPQGMPGYNPKLTGPQGASTYGNPAQARQLLQEGLQEEGITLSNFPSVKLTYPSNHPDIVNSATAMIQVWQTVLQVNVTANPTEGGKEAEEIDATTNNKNGLQFWPGGWGDVYPDPRDWLTLPFDKGSFNTSNYGQNQSDDAAEQQHVQQQLEAADIIQDPATRYKVYNDLEQQLVNDVAWLPLWQVVISYRVKPYVQGLVVNPVFMTPPDDWATIYIAAH